MRKALIAFVAMLVLVIGVGLIPAIPDAQAADICVSKDTVPGSPHEYHIGDTIDYIVTVQNPNATHSMTVDVWDELPPYGDNPNSADMIMLDDDATFSPGEKRTYNVSYVVEAADMEQMEVDGTIYNVVVNALRVHGEQHYGLIDAEVTKPSIVIQPNTVTTIWADEEMVHAGDDVTLTVSEENTGDVSLTGAYVELFAGETSIDALDYTTAVPSGGNSDNVLDPGETWTWTRVRTVADDTTFVAVGHGLDPTGLDITPENCFKSEKDEVDVEVLSPGTEVGIDSDKSEVYKGESFMLTITETNTGEEALTGAYVELEANGSSIATLDVSTATPSGGNSDNVLDPGETWTWTANRTISATTTFVAMGHGTDPLGLDISFDNGFEEERDEVTVEVICINPNTLVTITADEYVVHSGDQVELTISEKNTGDCALTGVYVELHADGAKIDTLNYSSATPSGGNSDNVLDPGETWTWTRTRSITDDTTFVAIGHGLDPTGLDITYENCFKSERDEITVEVVSPGTEVNISCVDDKVLLTITETNTGDVSLTEAYVEIFANGVSVAMLGASTATPSGGNSDNVLDPGETWTWTWTQCISETTTFVAIGHGMDPTGLDVTYDNGFLDERDQVTLRIICVQPNTLVSITADETEVYADESVDLTISEMNTGCVSLTEAYVDLFADGELIETLTFLTATPSGGNSDNVLDPGEIWTWTVNRTINATSTFVAIGHGTDPGGLDITYENGFPDERDEVTVHTICINPDTLVMIDADAYVVPSGEEIELTISETNTGDCALTGVYVELLADGTEEAVLTYSTATPSGGNSDNVLDPGETWTWTVTVAITVDTTFAAIGHGIDPTGLDVTYPDFEDERDEVTVYITAPGTEVTIAADRTQVYKGEEVTLTITETNTGEDNLTTPYVELFANGVSIDILDYSTATPSGGNSDNVLNPGENWTWTVDRTINMTTTFVAVGHGIDPTEADITYPQYPDERDEITVELMPCGEATRTQGFWKTHYAYTSHVFTEHLGGSIDLGWVELDSADDVIGMFWASVARTSTGAKRDQLCQARVIASHQAVAAILNSSLENGAPLPMEWQDIMNILGGSDIAAIKALGEDLDYYNNSGDDADIVDSDGYAQMSANPQMGKSIDTSIADCSSMSDGVSATSADISDGQTTKGKTARTDLSPAFYGLAALAAGLAILVPVGVLRSKKSRK